MKKAVCAIILLCAMLSGYALAFDPVPGEVLYVVNNPDSAERLNLRTRPDMSAPSLGRYYNGVRLEALSRPENGWIHVAVEGQRSVKGYMQAKYLVHNPSTPVASAIPLVAVSNKNGTGLNLREEPSVSAATYTFVENGTTVAVLGWGEQWCHVRHENLTAYLLTSGLAFESSGSGSGVIPGANWLHVNNPIPMDRLHLRTAPRSNATSLGKYYNGVSVEVLSYPSGDWAEVRIGNAVGYMQRKFLTAGSVISAIPTLTVSNPVSADRLNLRAEMSDKAASLGKYDNGTKVEVLGVGTTWHHVRIDGKIGYMMAKYLTPIGGTGSAGGGSRIAGVTTNVVISYDPATTHPFSQTDLDAAAASIVKFFQENYTGCEMVRLWYDEARSDEMLLSFSDTVISPNFIVFLCEFNVVTGSYEMGFEPGRIYDGWLMIAKRKDSQSPWVAGTLGLT